MIKKAVIATMTTFMLGTPALYAETYNDQAPVINPAVSNGQSVLVDNTHGQTAGAADWVIDGAFSDFGRGVAAKGYQVKELRKKTAVTYEDLAPYDVFVIPEANIPFKQSEQDAILKYVKEGGSVFFIADHYNADRNLNRYDSSEIFNGYRRGAYGAPAKGMTAEEAQSVRMSGVTSSDWLSNNFGVRFRYNALSDLVATDIVKDAGAFGITAGINSVAMHAGSTIALTNPDIAKGLVYVPSGLTTADKWGPAVDQGVYFGGGKDEGAYVAISKVGLGKAAFIGDSSMVEDATPKYLREDNGQTKKTYDGYKEQDDSTLLTNIVSWLSRDESYTSFKEKGLTLDQASPILSFEVPAASTEPATEPWSTPAATYKWYDESTFKQGSYGYSSLVSSTGYDFVLPVVTNGQSFNTTLVLNGLTPNTTYNDLKVGIYNTAGTQLGSFYMNNQWSAVGYSPAVTLTTDARGSASTVITAKTTKGITGNANIRLKRGTSSLYTEAFTIK
ncbi:DNA-binding protein [Macrococcus equipercicus]|uniref:DNA-binding protein n=1 Tax=Macrococcus equipercicus TaxID=69967 RepID=A0ABQ6R8K4_9STAP|nr:DNA-binding protein [Macrococcus equipercicus]KAA1039460.1 DNA-binding protein [Macrococcus equipercicus]